MAISNVIPVSTYLLESFEKKRKDTLTTHKSCALKTWITWEVWGQKTYDDNMFSAGCGHPSTFPPLLIPSSNSFLFFFLLRFSMLSSAFIEKEKGSKGNARASITYTIRLLSFRLFYHILVNIANHFYHFAIPQAGQKNISIYSCRLFRFFFY